MIKTAYLSECGGREYNDDTVRVTDDGERVCLVVADGLGGYAGGSVASGTAAELITSKFQDRELAGEEQMRKAVEEADRAVFQRQKEANSFMKTTLVTLVIDGNQARWMHVGDSRLYYFENKKLVRQTMDHSVSQVAVLMGEIGPEEVRFHEDRNRVLRALGSDNAKPDVSEAVKLNGACDFLLCTDGFWEYVYEEEMESELAKADSPKEWLENMKAILKSRAPENHDNYSAAAASCRME